MVSKDAFSWKKSDKLSNCVVWIFAGHMSFVIVLIEVLLDGGKQLFSAFELLQFSVKRFFVTGDPLIVQRPASFFPYDLKVSWSVEVIRLLIDGLGVAFVGFKVLWNVFPLTLFSNVVVQKILLGLLLCNRGQIFVIGVLRWFYKRQIILFWYLNWRLMLTVGADYSHCLAYELARIALLIVELFVVLYFS